MVHLLLLQLPRAHPLQVKGLVSNREALVDALSPLGAENVVGGEGAIYLFAKLPEGEQRIGACLGLHAACFELWSACLSNWFKPVQL